MSDKDTKIEKILENKLNYQNNTTTTEDVVDDTVIDEVAREVKEYISKLPEEEKAKALKEMSDELRQSVLEDVIMTQLFNHIKGRDN